MSARTTLYLEENLYKAAKVKAALTDQSLSDIVNEALRVALREDEADLSAFEKRKNEPARSFESVLKGLKRDGLL